MHKMVNGKKVKLTKAEEKAIKAEWAEALKKQQENQYAEDRANAYPGLEKQLDMLYWDMKNGTTEWLDLIDSIKTKHPKSKKK